MPSGGPIKPLPSSMFPKPPSRASTRSRGKYSAGSSTSSSSTSSSAPVVLPLARYSFATDQEGCGQLEWQRIHTEDNKRVDAIFDSVLSDIAGDTRKRDVFKVVVGTEIKEHVYIEQLIALAKEDQKRFGNKALTDHDRRILIIARKPKLAIRYDSDGFRRRRFQLDFRYDAGFENVCRVFRTAGLPVNSQDNSQLSTNTLPTAAGVSVVSSHFHREPSFGLTNRQPSLTSNQQLNTTNPFPDEALVTNSHQHEQKFGGSQQFVSRLNRIGPRISSHSQEGTHPLWRPPALFTESGMNHENLRSMATEVPALRSTTSCTSQEDQIAKNLYWSKTRTIQTGNDPNVLLNDNYSNYSLPAEEGPESQIAASGPSLSFHYGQSDASPSDRDVQFPGNGSVYPNPNLFMDSNHQGRVPASPATQRFAVDFVSGEWHRKQAEEAQVHHLSQRPISAPIQQNECRDMGPPKRILPFSSSEKFFSKNSLKDNSQTSEIHSDIPPTRGRKRPATTAGIITNASKTKKTNVTNGRLRAASSSTTSRAKSKRSDGRDDTNNSLRQNHVDSHTSKETSRSKTGASSNIERKVNANLTQASEGEDTLTQKPTRILRSSGKSSTTASKPLHGSATEQPVQQSTIATVKTMNGNAASRRNQVSKASTEHNREQKQRTVKPRDVAVQTELITKVVAAVGPDGFGTRHSESKKTQYTDAGTQTCILRIVAGVKAQAKQMQDAEVQTTASDCNRETVDVGCNLVDQTHSNDHQSADLSQEFESSTRPVFSSHEVRQLKNLANASQIFDKLFQISTKQLRATTPSRAQDQSSADCLLALILRNEKNFAHYAGYETDALHDMRQTVCEILQNPEFEHFCEDIDKILSVSRPTELRST